MEIDKKGILLVLLIYLIVGIIAFLLIYFGYSRIGLLCPVIAPVISYFAYQHRQHKRIENSR
ncbi:hypothetical protein [Lactobacillus gigeriorum]|uniref:Uncharacterized protein n=1 Tax=Lactobacillus gigeriorum DSM 23908 = CRBIP 24.85 TaxID=1423751 RepID=I7K023_9LACO|nr:hypothetical protein [Lactobacillus gigeriorum]KRN14390.1 hypothetical protein FC38_GL001050 [Lactobacillus gigeriorum DSM 23908 = CRBIP 24.85]CCI86605.1 Protein of unknown function [Lactobacillus gigeriorum DSM 23908 = CRBIP 24.85]